MEIMQHASKSDTNVTQAQSSAGTSSSTSEKKVAEHQFINRAVGGAESRGRAQGGSAWSGEIREKLGKSTLKL